MDALKSRLALRTYSKRVLQDSYKPPSKRQRVQVLEPIEKIAEVKNPPPPPRLPNRRSISDYFESVDRPETPSSSQLSTFSSDPITGQIESPPSSPPPLEFIPSVVPQKVRARRRLTTRPPLQLLSMNDQNSDEVKKKRKSKYSPTPPCVVGSPLRTSYLSPSSAAGMRKQLQGGTSSGESTSASSAEDMLVPGAVPIETRGSVVEPLTIPFAPTRHSQYRIFGELGSQSRTDTNNISVEPQLNFNRISLPVERQSTFNRFSLPDAVAMDDSQVIPTRGLARATSLIATGIDRLRTATGIGGRTATRTATRELLNNQIDINTGIIQANMSAFASTHGPTGQDPGSAQTQSSTATAPVLQASGQASGNLVQTQLALGVPTHTTCRDCRFTFNPTILDDRRLHNTAHETHLLGFPVRNVRPVREERVRKIWSSAGEFGEDYIVVVDSTATPAWKSLTLAVLLEQVDKELGCMPMGSERLWSIMADPFGNKTDGVVNEVPRYKVYMYVKSGGPRLVSRVVSVLLAERITEGYETDMAQAAVDEFGIWPAVVVNRGPVVYEKVHEAVLGVNKIWTHKNHRAHGLATRVLDKARHHYLYSHKVPRVHVAWTYTTELGRKFATYYMANETEYAYLTYQEDI